MSPSDPTVVLGPDIHGRTVTFADERIVDVKENGAESVGGSSVEGSFSGSDAPKPEDREPSAQGVDARSDDVWSRNSLVECRNSRIECGAVNAHTHVYSGLAPLGMPSPLDPPENFPQILERIWWCLDCALDEHTLRASARYYMAHALLVGTTTLIDHHESPNYIDGSLDVLAAAAEEVGIRVVLGYGATERNDGRKEARAGLAECRRFIRSNLPSTARGLVALHASFTVSDETVLEAGDLCRELGVGLHTHLAEASDDVDDAIARGYAGPWERFVKLAAAPAGSIMAHGVHLPPASVDDLSARNCWIVQNPRSNEGNDVGYPQSIHRAERVALGTDGYPADMPEEIQHLERISSAQGQSLEARSQADRGRVLAGEIFEDSFDLGSDGVADLVIRDDKGVRDVFVAGRHVVRDRRVVGVDLDEVENEAKEQAARLWGRMQDFQSRL